MAEITVTLSDAAKAEAEATAVDDGFATAGDMIFEWLREKAASRRGRIAMEAARANVDSVTQTFGPSVREEAAATVAAEAAVAATAETPPT